MTKRILVLSDLHCGSLAGLTPPGWQMEKMRFASAPLWDWYVQTLHDVGPVDVCVVNGDMVDGEGKAGNIWQITTDVQEQSDIAIECLNQVMAGKRVFVYGTPFHTVGVLNYEKIVSNFYGEPIDDTAYLDINGVKFSFRHVTGNAGTPYTHGTQAYKEAVRDFLFAVENDDEPADVVVRSHVHNFIRVETPERIAITTPCLQVPISVFGRKCRSWRYHIGMVLIEVTGAGEVGIKPYIMPLRVVSKREYVTV